MPALIAAPAAAALTQHTPQAGARWASLLAYLLLAALAAGYGRGVHELWRRRGTGAVVPVWRAAAFAIAILVLAVALTPAVHAAADRSFAAHMAEHMVLLIVAGPLLAAGAMGLPLSIAAPRALRHATGRVRVAAATRWLRRAGVRAVVAGLTQTLVVLGWHLPGPYRWALDSEPVHGVEHASLLAAAWLLWSCLLSPARYRLPGPAALLLLFTSSMPAAGFGILLAVTSQPMYPPAVLAPAGGDPVAAQQLAGLVMWAPMEAMVVTAAVAVFLRWLARMERRLPAGSALSPTDTSRQEAVMAKGEA